VWYVDRQVVLGAQCRDQLRGGRSTQQPGHVLDRQHVGSRVDDLFGQLEVVVQRVGRLRRVGKVGGVAQCDLGKRTAGLTDRVDRGSHPCHVVECVENAENVDSGGCCLRNERVGHLGGVRRVSDRVAATQQHL